MQSKRIGELLFLTLFASLMISACSKGGTAPPPPNEPELPANFADSAAFILGRWNLVKDSATNNGTYYVLINGSSYYPMPGVYPGVPGDNYDFKPDGTVSWYGNGNLGTDTYKLYPNNRLNIALMEGHTKDTGTIRTLTSTSFVFDFRDTSPNGGKWFKRVYLSR